MTDQGPPLSAMAPAITISGIPVRVVGDEIQWLGPLAVDADGSPRAYHPDGGGLDALGNAGKPGNWYGVVTDTGRPDGTPVVQGASDPAPGFFVSPTALHDPTRHARDPLAYVDSSTIPYVSIPPEVRQLGARLGDVALVTCVPTGKACAAIVADVGPHGKLGEGSIALATALGLDPSARHGGTERSIVAVRLFMHSAATPAWPRTGDEIARQVAAITAPPDPASLS